jgi:molybdopterin-guanine dinucleotide biosynthesis protein A
VDQAAGSSGASGDSCRPLARRGQAGQQRAPFDAVVLAGGHGRRLAGVDKPALVVGGRPLMGWVVAAATGAGAGRVVVVGPSRALPPGPEPPGGLVTVREEPPGAGPVPALRRGLAEVAAPAVAVLAADLPFLRSRHLRALLRALAERPGAVMADPEGEPQWLTGCWRTAVLRAAAGCYGGSSLRGLLGPLGPALIHYDLAAGEPPPWLDCDTAADLGQAQRWAAGGPDPAPSQPPAPAPGAAPPGKVSQAAHGGAAAGWPSGPEEEGRS